MHNKITTTSPTTTTTTTTTTTSDNNSLHILISISCICFLTVTALHSLIRAHAQGNLSTMIGGIIFMYLVSVSIICCSMAISRMPIKEVSPKKSFLVIMLMVLSTILVFGAIIHISALIGTTATVIILVTFATIYGIIFFVICYGYFCYKESNKSLAGSEKTSDHKIIKASDEPNSTLENV
ncbi:hypothetical protein NE237_031985 [Protea cynaroides]|uniref:Uncharacterized protein n=1 Tax=Protea cynaroides TaxID=273540 RepID=A0A9Q0R2P0_9MAGN|nr:hypothetical protein NE237_031985 [Protea cynaroides]